MEPLLFSAGRPKEGFNNSVQATFIRAKEIKDLDQFISKSATTYIILLRKCGVHCCSVQSCWANRKNEFFGCHICEGFLGRGARQSASKLEVNVDTIIRQLFPNALIVTQARLQNSKGGTDFEIVINQDLSLDVEADGEQHIKSNYKTTTQKDQEKIDNEKDRQTMLKGRRLVRLHYLDEGKWEDTLYEARMMMDDSFVVYSPSYHRMNIENSR